VQVPYRGQSQSLTDLIAGRVQVMFDTTPPFLQHIKADELRALAVGSVSRWSALPDLPAIAEFVPGYDAGGWYGIGAPKGTPPNVVASLNAAINVGLSDVRTRERLVDLGVEAVPGTPADFANFIAAETKKADDNVSAISGPVVNFPPT